ncbi:nucleotide pyrophosphohydrolase [candidate division TA06 bacterium DG_26]|uniref:Nucleotide pyrophosphohydrolase n=1 Tax=candidate division TA06 bacterium DG_26 TaxID=1703771 RepID=A0A0S7WK22_UNCT6|nr:MAG: nucleotide pyrophosphohydrolase [candidate division TA06 bacterium DG_26]
MQIREFQELIRRTYFGKDKRRGIAGTYQWFVEEVGELARAMRKNDRAALEEEFADCLAWLVSLATLHGIDMAMVAEKYRAGCPKCGVSECQCEDSGLR